MNRIEIGSRRRVAVYDFGSPLPDELTEPTDIAIVVLHPTASAPDAEQNLETLRERAHVVMGIVVSDGTSSAAGPSLAVLREHADILAHVGPDVDLVVEDLTSTFVDGSMRSAPQSASGVRVTGRSE